MFRSLLEAVRAEVSGERALESVRAIARYHRVQSSPGYDEAAAWVAAQAAQAGLEVEIDSVPGDGRTRMLGQLMPEGWVCAHAVATLLAGGRRERICDYAAAKLSLVLRSEPAKGRHRIVVLEDGSRPEHYQGLDVRGAVVLTRGSVHRVLELAVHERGAAGILYDGRRLVPPVRDRFDDPDALTYTSFWWNGDAPRGWGFVVSPRVGEQLRERLRCAEALELDVEIESRRFATDIPLVAARLPAQGRSEILIVSHLCHPQPSANDNASGVAAALEGARALASLAARGALGSQRHTIRFLWVPEFTGTFAWLARDPRRAERVVAALNLDMVGEDQDRCGSTFLIEHPPCFAASFAEELLGRIRREAVDWVSSYSGPGHYSLTRMAEVPFGGGSDHAVFIDPMIGVPCPMMIQWPDRYYHSSHDTPDKTDPRSLALAARCASTYAGFLATAGEREQGWLLEAVARSARTRLLGTLDDADPARAHARERLRSLNAMASLGRLGVATSSIDEAQRRFLAFAARETDPSFTASGVPGHGAAAPPGSERRPRRLLAAPLHHQRHLLAGYAALARDAREALHQLESAPDAGLLHELAWFACDGKKTLDDITRLVELESGRYQPSALASFFEWTVRLGLAEWVSGSDS